MMKSLPNILTIGRLAAAPAIAGLILWGDTLAFSEGTEAARNAFIGALILFVLAALTDAVDGLLARKLNAATTLGAALDHAADKALTTCTLVALSVTALTTDLIVAVIIILARDVTISGLREGLALSGQALPVGPGGKLKTVAVMIGAGAALAAQTLAYAQVDLSWLTVIAYIARGALWAGVALALWSAWDYIRAAITRKS